MTPENVVKKRIKEIFKKYGVFYWMTGSSFVRSGISDFIVVIGGRILVVEAKATPAEKPTPLQKKFIQDILRAGGVGLVIHMGNYDILEVTIQSMLQGEIN